MSNTYADATGVLLFDGPAKISPVIERLFEPFNLNAAKALSNDQCYVDVLSEESDPIWDSYLDHLNTSLPETLRSELANADPMKVLQAIGQHFGADLQAYGDAIDFDGHVNITDVVDLALLLRDGHNLIGLSMEGA